MSIKQTLAVAGALVLAIIAGTARPAASHVDSGVSAVQIKRQLASLAAGADARVLSDTQMSAVSGGFTKWRTIIRKLIQRIRKFIVIIICYGDTVTESTTVERVADATLTEDVTDYYENTQTIDEFYEDGVLTDTQESSTGYVFTGSSGGGGGGGGCSDDCELMY